MEIDPLPRTVKAVAAALLAAKKEIGAVKRDSTNPLFQSSYASIDSILQAIEPILFKNDLMVIHRPFSDVENNTVQVDTQILHAPSGEFVSATVTIPLEKNRSNAHGIGSAITYGRRYGLSCLLSLSAEDDDGNSAVGKGQVDQQPQGKQPTRPAAKPKEPLEPRKPAPTKPTGPTDDSPDQGDTGTWDTTVTDTAQSEGESSRGKWVRWNIKFANGKQGSTFDKAVGETAESLGLDDKCTVTWRREGKYLTIVSITRSVEDQTQQNTGERFRERDIVFTGAEIVQGWLRCLTATGSVFWAKSAGLQVEVQNAIANGQPMSVICHQVGSKWVIDELVETPF